MKLLYFSLFIIISLWFCKSNSTRYTERNSPVETNLVKVDASQYSEENFFKQISCEPNDCVDIYFQDYSEIDKQLNELMEQKVGKALIKMKYYDKKLNDEELTDLQEYLREITKRGGIVSIEPYYVRERGLFSYIPVLKDAGIRGFDIYQRTRNYFKYKTTEFYNAKVLYHPKTYNLMMVFFIHKNYGNVCDTIYSNCKQVEYIDDESFDNILTRELQSTSEKKTPIKVVFNQVQANLPDYKIDLETLKKLNNSARLYKWFVASKEVTKKKVAKERFLVLKTAISIIDYTMTAYDFIQQYSMYKAAFQMKAEVTYLGEERGGKIESVTFTDNP